ncbi:PucR family transcriptional regulator ligand-binding domain-containing protein [Blautia liquoris]|mgnify:CR=1 FL=1|uniref:PucR family transcriptional regulator ligand-binding domain-containing protein n=1 Tax=Blautia liquoris TaxID=2779518 RepID=A0A7M2RJJ4_9FIRM|nr:PucR family transcriptional regulator [Blautia liquoris]QOV19727.1 PucR family transcriptional regulator ligand-binding domain-containing protein [Blautia liquoris]
MGFTVEELLKIEEVKNLSVICGQDGLKNEIKGVTIIEAPDIAKFINGGELLLTGLFAFKTCSVDEYKDFLRELGKKEISGLALKRGRTVKEADVKIELLKEFARDNHIPLIEVPFELSFQVIIGLVMEHLFSDEVTQLKYYKTTHDNFSALTLSNGFNENKIRDILGLLDKMICNPVSLYDQYMSCYETTAGEKNQRLKIAADATKYDPGILTNYIYLKQEDEHNRYIVEINLNVGLRMYLVVTEMMSTFSLMDCIALENAIIALQYEFSRIFAVSELEKKFQNDLLHNILSGNIESIEELKKSSSLLDVNIDGYYRVVVFGVTNEKSSRKDTINEKMHHIDLLEETVAHKLPKSKVYRDLDKIVVVMEVNSDSSQIEYREELKDILKQIQAFMTVQNKYLKVKAGVGRIVQGILQLPKTYKEANDAFLFVDIAGDIVGESAVQMMLFSDLGIFKLLCQLDDPEMLREYVPETLGKLYDYKKPQRDDLIMTLKTYLDKNQNLSKTAKSLYVHYKTAAYRIEKIEKITGIDFNNANEVLAVRIGLIVHRMIENYEKKVI